MSVFERRLVSYVVGGRAARRADVLALWPAIRPLVDHPAMVRRRGLTIVTLTPHWGSVTAEAFGALVELCLKIDADLGMVPAQDGPVITVLIPAKSRESRQA